MSGRPQKPIDQSTYRGQIAARIRARRENIHLSAEDAAALAGVPRPTWYHWERGTHLPIDAIPAIAAALRTTPRKLLPE